MATPAKRPVIFLAFANDREDGNRYLRNLPEEARRLQAILEPLDGEQRCILKTRQNVTAKEVLDFFQNVRFRNRIAIFHFGCHSDSVQLMVETGEGKAAFLNAKELALFLGHQRGLKLVFLNACSNQAHVQELLDAGVDAVVATSHDIDDAIATHFAGRFYKALAGGANVQSAYDEAVQATKLEQSNQPRHLLFRPSAATQAERNAGP